MHRIIYLFIYLIPPASVSCQKWRERNLLNVRKNRHTYQAAFGHALALLMIPSKYLRKFDVSTPLSVAYSLLNIWSKTNQIAYDCSEPRGFCRFPDAGVPQSSYNQPLQSSKLNLTAVTVRCKCAAIYLLYRISCVWHSPWPLRILATWTPGTTQCVMLGEM